MSTDKKMKYHRYIVKPPSLKLKKMEIRVNSLCIINV